MNNEDQLLFDDGPQRDEPELPDWKLLVVDDEPDVHDVTRLALSGVTYAERRVAILSAYSAKEAKQKLREHPDTAVVLLDVVMERDSAGLEVIDYARTKLHNQLTRFVLRTGQPGQAPEREVVVRYDITDYKTKTELTATKLFTSVVATLRTYDRLFALANHRRHAEATAAALAKFVPHEFLSLLRKKDITELRLGDQVQSEMTIMFVDIRGFTKISQTMTPAECFRFINVLFRQVCPKVREYGGFIDKFLGDGFMALFPGRSDNAVAAAVAIQRAVAAYNASQGQRASHVQLGIGLHSGCLMLGAVGEEERMETTVLSDSVNLAARVETLTKRYGVGIVISDKTVLALSAPVQHRFRFLDKVKVKGVAQAIAVYEVLDGEDADEVELKLATAADLTRGQDLYGRGLYAEAALHFDRVLRHNPEDTVARLHLQRAALAMLHGSEHATSTDAPTSSGVWVALRDIEAE